MFFAFHDKNEKLFIEEEIKNKKKVQFKTRRMKRGVRWILIIGFYSIASAGLYCPLNQLVDSVNNICQPIISKCENVLTSRTTCDIACLWGTYQTTWEKTHLKSCLKCPEGMYVSSDQKKCRYSCPEGELIFRNDKNEFVQCLKRDKCLLLTEEGKDICVSNCPELFEEVAGDSGKTCSPCPNYFNIVNKKCVDTCERFLVYERKCVFPSLCPFYSLESSTCVSQCAINEAYSFQRIKMGDYNYLLAVCQDCPYRHAETKQCLSDCPFGSAPDNDKKCRCTDPDQVIDDDTCIYKTVPCSHGKAKFDGYCRFCSALNMFWSSTNDECVEQCQENVMRTEGYIKKCLPQGVDCLPSSYIHSYSPKVCGSTYCSLQFNSTSPAEYYSQYSSPGPSKCSSCESIKDVGPLGNIFAIDIPDIYQCGQCSQNTSEVGNLILGKCTSREKCEGYLYSLGSKAFCGFECPASTYATYDLISGNPYNGLECTICPPDSPYTNWDNVSCVSQCLHSYLSLETELFYGQISRCRAYTHCKTVLSHDKKSCLEKCPAGQFAVKKKNANYSFCQPKTTSLIKKKIHHQKY